MPPLKVQKEMGKKSKHSSRGGASNPPFHRALEADNGFLLAGTAATQARAPHRTRMRNSLNPIRGAAHNGRARSPRQRARDGVPSAPLLPRSCILERGRPSSCALPEQGREDNGRRRDLSPWSLLSKMLERPPLQLQGLGRAGAAPQGLSSWTQTTLMS